MYFIRMLSFLLSFNFAALSLVAITDPYCHVCERWHQEIGDQYHMFEQSHHFPKLVEMSQDSYANQLWVFRTVGLLSAIPTFVIMDDDEVLGQIEGYTDIPEFTAQVDVILKRYNESAPRDGLEPPTK
ncbi:thioredoxin family protein [Gammaproteobacteria bacterium]|nr:thioredoxin family protein [Gammaproteobacteria bacterium]